jgi:hypothetical protein
VLTAACDILCKKFGPAQRSLQPEKPCHSLPSQIFITNDTAHRGQGEIVDPITLILTSLAAGAAAGGQSFASDAVKDSYVGLKALIARKFAGKPSAKVALNEHESDPETWEVLLKKELMQEHIDQDREIVEAAKKVMTLMQPQEAVLGRPVVQINGDVNGLAWGKVYDDPRWLSRGNGGKSKQQVPCARIEHAPSPPQEKGRLAYEERCDQNCSKRVLKGSPLA